MEETGETVVLIEEDESEFYPIAELLALEAPLDWSWKYAKRYNHDFGDGVILKGCVYDVPKPLDARKLLLSITKNGTIRSRHPFMTTDQQFGLMIKSIKESIGINVYRGLYDNIDSLFKIYGTYLYVNDFLTDKDYEVLGYLLGAEYLCIREKVIQYKNRTIGLIKAYCNNEDSRMDLQLIDEYLKLKKENTKRKQEFLTFFIDKCKIPEEDAFKIIKKLPLNYTLKKFANNPLPMEKTKNNIYGTNIIPMKYLWTVILNIKE